MASRHFLSAHRKLLLEAGREELAEKLNVRNSLLVDHLRERNVLTDIQDEKLRPNDNTERDGDSKYANMLIDIMLRKSNKDFDIFLDALQSSGQESLADYFFSDEALGRLTGDLQVALGGYFLDCYNDDLFSWHDEGHVVNLRDVYVPIQWVYYDKSPGDIETSTLMDYHQVFLQDNEAKTQKILIRGEASSGKTTFLRKVCQDWATLHIEGTTVCEEVSRSLSQFEVVLPVILRLVKKEATIESTLCDQLSFLSDQDRLTMKWMMNHKQESVLFILDGFDEYDAQTSKEISMIIEGSKYSKASCVVTTRAEAISRRSSWAIYQEAELKGFDKKHITAYIFKFFEKLKDGKKLASELCDSIFPKDKAHGASQEVQDLQELASNPGRLCMLCTLYKEDGKLRTNRTQLYTAFITFILRRWEMRSINEHKHRSPQRKIMDNHRKILMKLGELANLRADGAMQVVFSASDVEEVVGEEVLQFGFLYKSHPVSRLQDCQLSFLHKSVQEYLAAYYIAHDESKQLLNDLLEKCYDLSCMRAEGAVLRFLVCFLKPAECFNTMVTILKHHCGKATFWWEFLRVCKTIIDILCDFESPLPQELEPVQYYQVDDVHFIYHFPRVLLCTRHQKESLGTTLASPPTLGEPVVINCVHGTEALFCYSSKPADYMMSFIPGCDISTINEKRAVLVVCGREMEIEIVGDVEMIKELKVSNVHKLLGLPQNFRQIQLNSFRIVSTDCHGSAGTIFPVACFAKTFDMSDTNLDQEDIKQMKNSESKSQNQHLFLDKNDLSGSGSYLPYLIPTMNENVCLRSCNMTKSDVEEFSNGLKMQDDKKNVDSLDLSGNDLKGSGTELAKIVACLWTLHKLRVYNCNLHADDVDKFVNGLLSEGKTLRGIEPLGLNGNKLTNAGPHMVRLFPLMKDCVLVELHNCHLTDEDMRLIVECLTGVAYDTSDDTTHGTDSETRTVELPIPKINSLVFSQNNLRDIKPILHLLQYLPKSLFNKIDINSNPFGDKLLKCIDYKKKVKNLRLFYLKKTGLSESAKTKLKKELKQTVSVE